MSFDNSMICAGLSKHLSSWSHFCPLGLRLLQRLSFDCYCSVFLKSVLLVWSVSPGSLGVSYLSYVSLEVSYLSSVSLRLLYSSPAFLEVGYMSYESPGVVCLSSLSQVVLLASILALAQENKARNLCCSVFSAPFSLTQYLSKTLFVLDKDIKKNKIQ